MLNLFSNLQARLALRDEDGQGLVEYALILVLIAIVVIVTLGLLGDEVDNIFQKIQSALTT